MGEKDLLVEILRKTTLTLSTRKFVEDLQSKFDKFGVFTDSQRSVVLKIASQAGIPTQGERRSDAQEASKLEVIKGSCGDCHDGLMLVSNISTRTVEASPQDYQIREGTPFVFKCSCQVGTRRQEKYPTWIAPDSKYFLIDKPSMRGRYL